MHYKPSKTLCKRCRKLRWTQCFCTELPHSIFFSGTILWTQPGLAADNSICILLLGPDCSVSCVVWHLLVRLDLIRLFSKMIAKICRCHDDQKVLDACVEEKLHVTRPKMGYFSKLHVHESVHPPPGECSWCSPSPRTFCVYVIFMFCATFFCRG